MNSAGMTRPYLTGRDREKGRVSEFKRQRERERERDRKRETYLMY
jgi:hypothetical protein